MPEEQKDYLKLEENARDILSGYLVSYISCLEGILEERQDKIKTIEYDTKKLRGEKITPSKDEKIRLLEEEKASIKSHMEIIKNEIINVQDMTQKLRTLTYCVLRPTTISQAKWEISQKTGAPENIIDIEIDYVTPIYTQYSLGNRLEVYENATNKDKVADYYRFPSRTFEE